VFLASSRCPALLCATSCHTSQLALLHHVRELRRGCVWCGSVDVGRSWLLGSWLGLPLCECRGAKDHRENHLFEHADTIHIPTMAVKGNAKGRVQGQRVGRLQVLFLSAELAAPAQRPTTGPWCVAMESATLRLVTGDPTYRSIVARLLMAPHIRGIAHARRTAWLRFTRAPGTPIGQAPYGWLTMQTGPSRCRQTPM
jgi:hypothetical protein